MPNKPADDYLDTRRNLVKALHTVTTVSRLAAKLIEKGERKTPETAVRLALEWIGQLGDWRADDDQLVKCIAATKRLIEK